VPVLCSESHFLGLMSQDEIQKDHKLVLHAGMKSGSNNIIRMLLDAGADVGAKNGDGLTALPYAPMNCETSVLARLLGKGADVNEQDSEGRTLLHKMAAADNLPVLRFLVERDADISKITLQGETVLHSAVAGEGHEKVFQYLLLKGANIEARDKAGYTPFHKAVNSWRSQNTLRILLALNANVEATNPDGETPLQTAVRAQNAGLVAFLLRQHARVSVRSKEGLSVLPLADISFIMKCIEYGRKKVYKQPYRAFCLLQPRYHDDNLFQNDSGTVQDVALRKIDLIETLLSLSGATNERRPKTGTNTSDPLVISPDSSDISINSPPMTDAKTHRTRRVSFSCIEQLKTRTLQDSWRKECILDCPDADSLLQRFRSLKPRIGVEDLSSARE
jgi:ankyrin repeat protein